MKTLNLSVLCLGLVACGAEDLQQIEDSTDEVVDSNGWRTNGWRTNGWRTNGWRTNGLAVAGLNQAAIDTAAFRDWFESADGASACTNAACDALLDHASLMKYQTACALRDGESVSYTDRFGMSYTWSGDLGLVPAWSSRALTSAEQRKMSACLLSHLNWNGNAVPISIRGLGLETTATETSIFTQKMDAFYGNLYLETPKLFMCDRVTSSGVVASVHEEWGRKCSSPYPGCDVITYMGPCNATCSGWDGQDWTSCRGNDGVTYNEVLNVYFPKLVHPTDYSPVEGEALATASGGASKMRGTPSGGVYRGIYGATGNGTRGYAWNIGSGSSSAISVTVNVPTGGSYAIELKYAIQGSGDAFAKVKVNDTTISGAATRFPGFGRAYTDNSSCAPTYGSATPVTPSSCWRRVTTDRVTFRSGNNTIKIQNPGDGSTAPIIDYFVIHY